MTPLFLLPLLVFSVQASPRPADSAPLRLLHRVLHPSLPDQSFFPRGSLLADQAGHAYIEPAPSLQHDLLAFAEASAQLTDALYQLALDPHTAEPDTPWLISSVKATVSLIIPSPFHSATSPTRPPNTSSSTCPLPTALRSPLTISSTPSPPMARAPLAPPTVALWPPLATPPSPSLSRPCHPCSSLPSASCASRSHRPELRVPPPLTSTGDPVVQVPEKTFLQKYWLYIVIALGALLLAPGGEEGAR